MTVRHALIVAALLLVALIVAFSTARSRLHCTGKMSTKVGPRPLAVDVRLERLRPGAAWWRGSQGTFWLEIPGEVALPYEIVKVYGEILDLALGGDRALEGAYSTSSAQLALRTPEGLFVGACSEVD